MRFEVREFPAFIWHDGYMLVIHKGYSIEKDLCLLAKETAMIAEHNWWVPLLVIPSAFISCSSYSAESPDLNPSGTMLPHSLF